MILFSQTNNKRNGSNEKLMKKKEQENMIRNNHIPLKSSSLRLRASKVSTTSL